MHCVEHRCFQAAEAEIEPFFFQKGPWKTIDLGISGKSGSLNCRSPGKAQTQDIGHLIKRFARSIVRGRSQKLEVQGRTAMKQAGVSAADHQSDTRENLPPRRQ